MVTLSVMEDISGDQQEHFAVVSRNEPVIHYLSIPPHSLPTLKWFYIDVCVCVCGRAGVFVIVIQRSIGSLESITTFPVLEKQLDGCFYFISTFRKPF